MLIDFCANAVCISPYLSRCQYHDNHRNISTFTISPQVGERSPAALPRPSGAATSLRRVPRLLPSSHALAQVHTPSSQSQTHRVSACKTSRFFFSSRQVCGTVPVHTESRRTGAVPGRAEGPGRSSPSPLCPNLRQPRSGCCRALHHAHSLG